MTTDTRKPNRRSQDIHFRATPALTDVLESVAGATDKSVSEIVREAVVYRVYPIYNQLKERGVI